MYRTLHKNTVKPMIFFPHYVIPWQFLWHFIHIIYARVFFTTNICHARWASIAFCACFSAMHSDVALSTLSRVSPLSGPALLIISSMTKAKSDMFLKKRMQMIWNTSFRLQRDINLQAWRVCCQCFLMLLHLCSVFIHLLCIYAVRYFHNCYRFTVEAVVKRLSGTSL